MEITTLGRTGLKVSRLCLGTMNFGPRTEEADAHQIMDAALGAGINFFDTADIYGPRGRTEEIVGRWLSRGTNREQVVLATKVYQPMAEGPNDRGLSARHIRQACEDSLRRLQTDYIDLYQMHHIDQPAVTAPIVGPGTLEQLSESLQAAELNLDDAILSRLEEIWPGRGPAPEAYAW